VSTRIATIPSTRVLIGLQVRDYAGLVDQAAQALRPNGLISLTETDFIIYGADKKPVPFDGFEFAPPYFPRWLGMVRSAVKERGGEVESATHLHRWVSEHPSFTDVVYRSFWFPASPWLPPDHPDAARLNRSGAFMRDDIQARWSWSCILFI